MKPHELKELLGERYAPLLLPDAYTKGYWKQVVHRDIAVTPEKLAAIVNAVDQHVKELQSIKKTLKSL